LWNVATGRRAAQYDPEPTDPDDDSDELPRNAPAWVVYLMAQK
jgi:hypothetical protein